MRCTLLTFLFLAALSISHVLSFPGLGKVDVIDKRALHDALIQAKKLAEMIKSDDILPKRSTPVVVPDPNDKQHQFQEPKDTDQRGPCPGMNTLANHGYLPRNGIATLLELIIAQKEGFNIDYDLGALLAIIAVGLDGDLLTTKVSLGGQDSRTMLLGDVQALISYETGIDGHNKFEQDSSLTRKDYYLNNGDDYTFQGHLYAGMKAHAQKYGANGRYDVTSMAKYRLLRYQQSREQNDRFYFGPKSFLLYGAASFVYAAFGNATEDLTYSSSSEASVSSFYGAVPDSSAPGGYRHVAERFPPNWYQRTTPFTLLEIVGEIVKQYVMHPVQFGANARNNTGRFFVPLPTSDQPFFVVPKNDAELANYCCALFQLVLDNNPGTVASPALILQSQLDYILGALDPVFKDSCNCGTPTSSGQATTTDLLAELVLPKAGIEAIKAGASAIKSALLKAKPL